METMTLRLVYFATLTALAASSAIDVEHKYSSLRGKVEDQFSRPVPKALVTLTSLERAVHTQAAPDGSFEFSDVPQNRYEVEINPPGFAKQKLSVDLRSDSTIRSIEIVLRSGSIPNMETCGPHSVVTYGPMVEAGHRLTGSIRTYDHNKPVAKADVTLLLTGQSEKTIHAISDKNGKYVFENLPAARYDLRISRHGYSSEDVKQLVVPSSNEVFVHTTILGGNNLVVCQ
jgi:hypothetical protein